MGCVNQESGTFRARLKTIAGFGPVPPLRKIDYNRATFCPQLLPPANHVER